MEEARGLHIKSTKKLQEPRKFKDVISISAKIVKD